ncbi:unnamed protein product [Trifolium pratense]|uniref:Uncharacterized protein n=1 Tax=Trifolium pratense TaxID=57577 RepID=A0ACB0IKD1_TRIPR|nr:unnamed protein product [Trifolium pratense]
MEPKKKNCSITTKDDRGDHDDHKELSDADYCTREPELDLSVEKQNLVPERKKFIMKNLNGFVLYEEYYDEHQDSSGEERESSQDSLEEPESSISVKKLNLVPKNLIPKKKNQNLDPNKKKLLVMNLNGFLLHKVYVHNKEALPKSRTDHYKSLNFLRKSNGELCEYLKGVAEAEDVQSYVEDNAFGMPALSTSDNRDGSIFYCQALWYLK